MACQPFLGYFMQNGLQLYAKPSWLGLKNILTAFLQRSKTTPLKCPGYDIKQSDGKDIVLEPWEM